MARKNAYRIFVAKPIVKQPYGRLGKRQDSKRGSRVCLIVNYSGSSFCNHRVTDLYTEFNISQKYSGG